MYYVLAEEIATGEYFVAVATIETLVEAEKIIDEEVTSDLDNRFNYYIVKDVNED